jgi:hypothetical protein
MLMYRRGAWVLILAAFFVSSVLLETAFAAHAGQVTVDIRPQALEHDFLPDEAFGYGLDGLEQGGVARDYTPANIEKIKATGFRRVSYRLRTELGIEAWHWNEIGDWSDPSHARGYWTSSDKTGAPILMSHGYRLPRRGDTIDQAGDDDYSRLDDGDQKTFWKSNPYLDLHPDGDAAQPPQWIFIDLGKSEAVNAAKIVWADPYAKRIQVQYWIGQHGDADIPTVGGWVDFPQGSFGQSGGEATSRLASAEIEARFIRFLLFDSSGTAPLGALDQRDRLGFAVREIYVGRFNSEGRFQDLMRHVADGTRQTVTYVSSTDPWHRAIDLDRNTEQPGIDRVFESGLTKGQPMLLPVGLLYDTPDNAVAMIRYARARGYALQQVEMGEEPDGQQVSPEHYGALYLAFADAIHSVDPSLALGGPGFQQGVAEVWPEADGDRNFLRRFANYLRSRKRLADLTFVSFEHYPFDNLCAPAEEQLLDAPAVLSAALSSLKLARLPPSVPWIITEYGFSAFAGQTMVEMPSALLNAEIVGQFLTEGGKAAYYYGAEPNTPMNELNKCAGYGNMMLYEADDTGTAKWPMPSFFGAELLTRQWAEPVNAIHRVYSAETNIRAPDGRQLVAAFAVFRPDAKWSVMLINKDPKVAHQVTIRFQSDGGTAYTPMSGALKIYQYGPTEFAWGANGENGHPLRTKPPRSFAGIADVPIDLPAYSLTIVQGDGPRP